MKTEIKLKGITKSYSQEGISQQILHGIDLTINRGDFLTLTGPSGGGKSTLLSILGLLEPPTSGSYLLQGQEVGQFSDELAAAVRNQLFGFVFQSFNLIPQLNIWENVALPLTYKKKLSKTELEREAKTYLELVKLTDKANNYPSQLSGGQQQRVAIARALITSPEILFADEPTGNLDSKNGESIMREFYKLNQDGQTIVMVTHNAKDLDFSSRIAVITDGNLSEAPLNK
ncbi:ABC transporter ATP-binding protein [Alteromonas sp. a30]|uniref:ABC transporter ATP-binding protein n=1 Tax=Alteromonas sp. a30 TaxID=2730917 RepID=UPI00227DCD69|nr:ABC transporter ATP-binding protein [Alteromonas sp. a30]